MTGQEETETGHKLRGRAQARPYKEEERRARKRGKQILPAAAGSG
jgi:hypothetical protein